MLRKTLLALGALAFCGAVQAQAGMSHGPDKGGPKDKNHKEDFKGPEEDYTLTFSFDLTDQESDILTALINGDSLPFHCLTYPEKKIIKDLKEDIQELKHDVDSDPHNKHEFKKAQDEVNEDAADITHDLNQFVGLLNSNDCRGHDDGCEHNTCAVPLPAAAAQGLMGFGVMGLAGLGGIVRRRFARSA